MNPVFARITKVDEVTRTVTGRAVQEMLDRDKEVFDYETSKPNFMKWSAEVFADTGGKSHGNVRAMHGSIAAGILTDIQFLDDEKAIDVSAKIVDDQEWKKVLSGTYSGFSIGGKYTKRWPSVVDGQVVNRYTAMPTEISIVDRPCVPAAKFFTVHKVDGSDVQVPFRNGAEDTVEAVKAAHRHPRRFDGDFLRKVVLPSEQADGNGPTQIARTGGARPSIADDGPVPSQQVERLTPPARAYIGMIRSGVTADGAGSATESGQQDESLSAVKRAMARPQAFLGGTRGAAKITR